MIHKTPKQILEESGITQQELADFMGIPRHRVGKWVQFNAQPSKKEDADKFTIAASFISQLAPDELPGKVRNYHIENGAVVRNKAPQSHTLSEPNVTYRSNEINKPNTLIEKTITSQTPLKQGDVIDMRTDNPFYQAMIDLVESNKLMARSQLVYAEAQKLQAEANLALVQMLKQNDAKKK